MAEQQSSPEQAAAESAAAGFPPGEAGGAGAGPVPAPPPGAEEAPSAADGDPAADAPPPAEPAPAEPDYKDLYLRASADMDNLRKRSRRDVGLAQERGVGRLAKELLPAIDNLERALQAAEAEEGAGEHVITKGIRLVQAEFVGALTRAGITIEDPRGQPFDPHRHEALAQAPTEGVAAGVVVEVYQPGYVLGEQVLRAARVVVSG